jgi:hypothetical protein
MRKLMKVLLPPFIGFAIYFLLVRYHPSYFSLQISEMGDGNLEAFMAFYRFLLPLLFTVAVLTQYLIVVPIWNKVNANAGAARTWAWLLLFAICFLFAAGMSYAIWDKAQGIHHLLKLFTFMFGIQFIYWMINLFILSLLEVRVSEFDKNKQNN